MNTVTAQFVNAQFAPLDHSVSHAEQQDDFPPVGEPAVWHVVALTLSPLLVIGVVSLIASFLQP